MGSDPGSNLPAIRPEESALSFYDHFENPFDAINKLGNIISTSGMFGKLNENQGKALAWHVLVKKIDPFDFKRTWHIMQDGGIAMRADAIAAEFIRKGGKIKWKSGLMDKERAEADFYDYDGDKFTFSITLEECHAYAYTTLWDPNIKKPSGEKLKDNWKNSGPDMLRARLISKSMRMLDPSIVAGAYTPEELMDKADEIEKPGSGAGFAGFGRVDPGPSANETKEHVVETKPAPVETTAEVIETSSVPSEAPAPTAAPKVEPAKAEEKPAFKMPATAKERMDLLRANFYELRIDGVHVKETLVDVFYVACKKLNPGQCLIDLADDYVAMTILPQNWTMIKNQFCAWVRKRHPEALKPISDENGTI